MTLPLLTANEVMPSSHWSGEPVDTVTLDYDSRFRRRVVLTGEKGRRILLDLPEATVLADGDGLVTEGGIVVVKAAPEELVEIRSSDPRELVRVAWHLGNRHLPTEIHDGVLRIRYDHVIVDMIEKLGASAVRVTAPFNPEGGAYGHGRTHDHHHHG